MANEIQFPYLSAGLLTLTANLYKSGAAGAGAGAITGISLSDSTSAGVYWGSVPTSPATPAGQYTVTIYDGANLVGSGQIQWDGTKEIIANDLAREGTLAGKASQTSVNSIPTNPLLTNDARLNTLDANISSRLASSTYTPAPSASTVSAAVLSEVVEGTVTVVESLRLSNSVLGGKVSGAGTDTNVFRDLADSKDRITSTVTSSGNRTNIIKDLT